MDEKDFKKHLAALVHGHHHPEEHDWAEETSVTSVRQANGVTRRAKSGARKTRKRRSK